MKTMFTKFAAALGVVLIAILLSATAHAGCGSLQNLNPGASLHRQSWDTDAAHPSLLLVQLIADPIVGMWQVKFTAEGNGPAGPPDGVVIDSAIVVWHNDGTEIMNSGRPAQDGNFCMGVWEKLGKVKYRLNHFALGNDTANAPSGIGNPAGPTRIVEIVSLTDADHYTGSFSLNAYSTSGKRTAHIIGAIAATRITQNTSVKDLL